MRNNVIKLSNKKFRSEKSEFSYFWPKKAFVIFRFFERLKADMGFRAIFSASRRGGKFVRGFGITLRRLDPVRRARRHVDAIPRKRKSRRPT